MKFTREEAEGLDSTSSQTPNRKNWAVKAICALAILAVLAPGVYIFRAEFKLPTWAEIDKFVSLIGWLFIAASIVVMPVMGKTEERRKEGAWYVLCAVWLPLFLGALFWLMPLLGAIVAVVAIPAWLILNPILWVRDLRERRKNRKANIDP